MNLRLVAGVIFLAAAAVFFYIGFTSEPRDSLRIILGTVFAILGSIRLRQARGAGVGRIGS